MNEEALKYSFDLFVKDGYNGTIDDYKELIKTNDKARSVSYNLFTSDGYNGSDADFNNLMGIDNTIMLSDEELGKTNDSANVDPSVESDTTESGSEETLSALQSIKNSFLKAGERLGDITEFWGADEGMGSAIDIATNSTYSLFAGQKNIDDFVEKYGEDSSLTAGLGTKETLEAIEKYKKEQEESSFKTKQITESIKKGDITGAGAGIVEAVINGVSSVAYFLGTGGAGIYAE
ncbi:MAG TPA: hypothetical protein DEG69_04395, partial [Flavobacteriaceae bacterium]|nr:hypothetical protein [Flavobacteriaceae bacterium]